MTKCYPLDQCWKCPSYDAGSLCLEDEPGSEYYGSYFYNQRCLLELRKINEFKNGNGIPSWCPLEEVK
jgi:hypothetical protein